MRLTALLCVLIVPPVAAQEPTWVDVTTTETMMTNGNGRGAAWIDYDGDGDLDLYASATGPNYLFQNDNGVLVDVSDSITGNDGPAGKAMWGDYDNDGDPDLFIVNGSTQGQNIPCVLLRNDSTPEGVAPVFVDVTPAFVPSYFGLVRGGAWGDFDNNGFLDLYISLWNGADHWSRLVSNTDGINFVDVTADPIWNIGIGRGVAFCDYDNDGDQDLFVVNGSPGGTEESQWNNRLFRNDGAGVWVDIFANEPFAGHGRGIAWGDYDNDGDMDAYIANVRPEIGTGINRLLSNNGDGTFTNVATGEIAEDERTRGCGFVDYDNDGDLDLYVTYSSSENKLFRNDGSNTWTEVAAGTVIADTCQGRAGAWGDYDADGDMDLYIVCKERNRVVRNDLSNGNNWLQVHLTGTLKTRESIGARIYVTTGSLTQMREVHREHGYFAEDMITQHFGLGTATAVDRVSIRWPSSSVRVLTNVAPDQRLEVVEPTCILDWDGDGSLFTADFLLFLNAHVQADPIADINLDGEVNSADYVDYLILFSALYLNGC